LVVISSFAAKQQRGCEMEHFAHGLLAICLALFLVLLTLVAIEDWQAAALAAVDRPEMQSRGVLYSPYGYQDWWPHSPDSAWWLVDILGNPDHQDHDLMKLEMRKDFDSLAMHGYTTIRIYYHPEYSEDPCALIMPDDTVFTAMDTLLKMLDEAGLKLYVTLTGAADWEDTCCYRPAVSDAGQYKLWLSTFLSGDSREYKNDSTIIMWDLRTEGDPEDSACNAWIDTILPYLQSIDSTTPVTRGIGCGKPWGTGSMRAIGDFDIYDWHAYVKTEDTINDTIYVTRQWTTLPVKVDTARDSCWEHTLSFGEFGYPVYKTRKVDQMPEMEQRQLYRNFFYKMAELGIASANVFRIYDTPGGKCCGIYRGEDRSFKPAGELIAQIFSGASWDTIPIIGNWHMELDDRLNWKNLWKPDPTCTESDTCGSIQPSCWRHKIRKGTGSQVSFAWDTTDNYNHTPDTTIWNFDERASLRISFDAPNVYDTCEAFWYFRCCEGGEKQHTAVAPGVFYACSAYVWYEGKIDSVGLGFRWYDVNGDSIGTNYRYISTSSLTAQQWQRIGDTCTAPVSPDSAYSCIISINAYSVGADTGSVWIDDVQLYEGLRWKTYYPDTIKIDIGTVDTIDMELFKADDGQYQTIAADTSDGDWWTDWYGEFRIEEDEEYVKRLWVGYDGHYSTGDVDNPKIQRIYLYNFDPDSLKWCLLCATANDTSCWNEIRQADITHGWSTANTDSIQDYIDPDGYIRLRVVTKDTVATYDCRVDHMRATTQYEYSSQ
jgi:hypothetical protein